MDISTYLNSPTQKVVCQIGFFLEDLLDKMIANGLITKSEAYGFSFTLPSGILKIRGKEWRLNELCHLLK